MCDAASFYWGTRCFRIFYVNMKACYFIEYETV